MGGNKDNFEKKNSRLKSALQDKHTQLNFVSICALTSERQYERSDLNENMSKFKLKGQEVSNLENPYS